MEVVGYLYLQTRSLRLSLVHVDLPVFTLGTGVYEDLGDPTFPPHVRERPPIVEGERFSYTSPIWTPSMEHSMNGRSSDRREYEDPIIDPSF